MTTLNTIEHKINKGVDAYTSYELDYKNLQLAFYNGMSAMLIDARAKLDYLRYTVSLMSKEYWNNRDSMPEEESSALSDSIWNAEQMIISLEAFVEAMEELS